MKTKQLVLAAFLMMAFLLHGCGNTKKDDIADMDFNSRGPSPVALKETKNIGRVRILTEGYWSIPDFVDSERCSQVLKLIGERIKQQRNIAMDLQIIRGEGTQKQIITGAASGDAPEILVRTYNDRPQARMPDPLRLNEAIYTYGPNLSKIPESCWELSRIGDSIISIPSVGMRYSAIVINKNMLDKYGWQIPISPEMLEQLLIEAKAAGLRPMDKYVMYIFLDWLGIHIFNPNYPPSMLVKDQNGKLCSIYESPEYELYMDTMKNWVENGYINLNSDDAEDDNWLIRGMYSDTIAATPNAVPMRPLSMTASVPATTSSLQVEYCFEAYSKPEALVTLMDWTYESEENHTLIAKGEEGIDFQLTGSSGYEFIESNKWEFQEFLSMDGFGNNRFLNCTNPEALKQGAADIDTYAVRHQSVSLPLVSWRYALPKTNLLKAWDDYQSYANAMDDAARQYISGSITREEYYSIAEESKPLIEGFIKLTNDYLAGTYDPSKEMYAPAQPEAAN